MAYTPVEIRHVKLQRGLFGYRPAPVDRLLTEKTQLAESIVGGGDEWLTDLSTSELREYLKLSDEAVGEF